MPHYFTDASNRCMVASNRCTIFCQRIILKAVMNKVSLNVLCLSLSFHLCPGVLSSPSFNPSIPQPITLVQSPVRPSALYQSNPLSPSNCMHQPICLTHSSPSIPLPLSVVKNLYANPSPSMFCPGQYSPVPEAVHKPMGSVSSSPSTLWFHGSIGCPC